MAEKLTDKEKAQMSQNCAAFMQGDRAKRLVGAAVLKEMIKTINPELRLDASVHAALVQQVGQSIFRGVARCYGNNRKTIKPVDL